jgi:ketosteroid isomerase-like protein
MKEQSAIRSVLALAVSALFLNSAGVVPVQAQEENSAEHEKLRALRDSFATALNAQDFAALKGLVSEDLKFTTISNEQINGLAELETYWKRLFDGDDSEMTGLKVSPEADALTEFIGTETGVVQGSSQDVYSFRKMGDREMTSRWTAVVKKVGDEWKVSHVHMSGNVLDNPVLDATATVGTLKTVIGFVVGLLISALVFRRKKA